MCLLTGNQEETVFLLSSSARNLTQAYLSKVCTLNRGMLLDKAAAAERCFLSELVMRMWGFLCYCLSH